ncbi:MAG: BamA/TamA family outer membrane protein, partial [Melioribacteraceae bacterium]|nr:BamA/TamA family outer membrane protein [Melioribacteraceae bacterium]
MTLCLSQVNLDLHFTETGATLPPNSQLEKSYPDSASISLALQKTVNELRKQGYILASLDSMLIEESSCYALLHLGVAYKWADISAGNLDSWIIQELGSLSTMRENQPFSAASLGEVMNQILDLLQNSGYPFARIKLDSIEFSDQSIKAAIHLEKGRQIRIDSIQITGDADISNRFMANYLDLQKGEIYSQEKILRIDSRLNNLLYIKRNKPTSVRFFENEASILLDIDNQSNSRFDFIIGVLPSNLGSQQEFTFVFDFTTEMSNKLGMGEYFYAQLQRLRPETQQLQLNFTYPYLLNLPFGLDLGFELYRNSKDFLNIDFNIGWQYIFNPNHYLKAFWNINSSRLLEIDEDNLIRTGKLPEQLDFNYNAGGVQFVWENLDYRFNPRSGFVIELESIAGLKEVVPNLEIEAIRGEGVDFSTSYDSLSNKMFQFKLETKLQGFLALGKRSTLMLSTRIAKIIAEAGIFENEYYRIGGNKLLRGFDEQSITGDFYMVFISEYRLLIDKNSYISAFVDNAWVQNPLSS